MALLLGTRVDMLHLMQPAPFLTAVQREGAPLLQGCASTTRPWCM